MLTTRQLFYQATTILCSASLWFAAPAQAASSSASEDDLLNLSLEQLSNISVTSVSKRSEKASEAAAAIYVITQDDIRRSGHTSIPELLRMVPGVSVAQQGAHQWALSARGFSGSFSNKLLVLMDGRSVYTPLFSGVYWDVQDTLLEDIERIEIIRGPGATLWGANAVNGVINIITKKAKDTQGNYASVTFGNQENGLVGLRHGGKAGDEAHYRVYAKYDDRDESETLTGSRGRDAWNKAQAGFRSDMKATDKLDVTVQGDVYRSGGSGTLTVPSYSSPATDTWQDRENTKGGNLLARFNYAYATNNDITLQAYINNEQRSNFVLNDNRNTLDLDLQQSFQPIEGHDVVWGAGYRRVMDDTTGSTVFNLSPGKRQDNLYSAFLQDKIALVPNSFYLTLGSKFEHNDYTGFEYQPSGRLSWLVDQKQTLWAAVTRAVRTPNRFLEDGKLASQYALLGGVTPAYIGTTGNRNVESEVVKAYELGYRIEATDNLSFDAATFYNDYDNLVLGSLGSATTAFFPGLGTIVYVPVTPRNLNEARSYGFELSSKWNVTNNFNLNAAYTYFELQLEQPDTYGFEYGGKTPKHQFNVRSNWALAPNVEWNNAVYFVDSLLGPRIPSYLRLDSRLAWRPVDSLELSLIAQNLLDPRHPEFAGYTYQTNTQVPRSVYGNISWKF